MCCFSRKIRYFSRYIWYWSKPTGNKDPFALRRSAIGILRILRDTNIDISLEKVIDVAIASYKKVNNLEFNTDVKAEIISFV